MQAINATQVIHSSTIVPFYNRQVDSANASLPTLDQIDLLKKELQYLRPQILTYCFRYLRNSEDAEEACQDTMLNATSSLSKFEGRASFKTWVLKIAYHVCTNYFRKNRHQKGLFDVYDDSIFCSNETLNDQDYPEITALLTTLSTVQQEILRYRFVDELSLKEIAIILGFTLSKVKMNYYRALNKMHKSFLA